MNIGCYIAYKIQYNYWITVAAADVVVVIVALLLLFLYFFALVGLAGDVLRFDRCCSFPWKKKEMEEKNKNEFVAQTGWFLYKPRVLNTPNE